MKKIATLLLAMTIVMLYAMPTLAHGVRITHVIDETTGEITVTAAFDTGEVLDEAQVIIFAPDDLINPWQVGAADETGSYTFLPDYDIEGFWDIQFRQAGHGGLINVEITADMMPEPADTTQSAESSDDAEGTTITLSDGSSVTISTEAQFTVEGDVITFITNTDNANADTVDSTDTQTTETSVAVSTNTTSGIATGLTPAQIALMSVSVIWGCVGTALYFTRGSKAK